MQAVQLKLVESSGVLVSPLTRPFLIICCRVSFPRWASRLWTRSKEGGMTSVVLELAETIAAGEPFVCRKKSGPSTFTDSTMRHPHLLQILQTPSSKLVPSPLWFRTVQDRRP